MHLPCLDVGSLILEVSPPATKSYLGQKIKQCGEIRDKPEEKSRSTDETSGRSRIRLLQIIL
ncbi:hypothetical protein LEP1GSC161_0772 [Leptospira santarosai str. CBC1416]|uniref:Uncharacterized protein n=1 Tax=Leptospira santarosai str. CBC1416 TaxID=1193059 RepID=M6VNY3_9LEPT|nr:hypothetical protein LEP1GSC161_0772 [Leptospira santarosai str. CBC1416]